MILLLKLSYEGGYVVFHINQLNDFDIYLVAYIWWVTFFRFVSYIREHTLYVCGTENHADWDS